MRVLSATVYYAIPVMVLVEDEANRDQELESLFLCAERKFKSGFDESCDVDLSLTRRYSPPVGEDLLEGETSKVFGDDPPHR